MKYTVKEREGQRRQAHFALNQLKTHSPLWVDIIRTYIRYLESKRGRGE